MRLFFEENLKLQRLQLNWVGAAAAVEVAVAAVAAAAVEDAEFFPLGFEIPGETAELIA